MRGEKVLFVRFNVSVPVSKLILKPAKRLVLTWGFCRLDFAQTDKQMDANRR